MKIGLYSGSFNPIHLGHTRLAQYMLEHTDLDEVWLVVSPNNPLKEQAGLLDEALRLQLCQWATAGMEGIRCSDVEFALPKPSYTITTLRTLTQRYPEHRFALIIGSDNMAVFDRWREWETILRDYPIYVYPRKGDDMNALRSRYPEMHVVENAPLMPVSSTEIRRKICSKTSISGLVHPDVEIFLKKNANLFAYIKENA